MEGSLVAYKVFTNGSVLQASELNETLMQQSIATFSNAAARTAAITSPVEGQTTYLLDTDSMETWNGSAWVNIANVTTPSYRLVQTVTYLSSGTFTKATYPWLRAIRVMVQSGGGSGGGTNKTAGAGGGGGGGYAEGFITNIAGLQSSITVTVGAGGAAPAAGDNNGNVGGNSGFPNSVSNVNSSGGAGGQRATGLGATGAISGGAGGIGTEGNLLLIKGSGGGGGFLNGTIGSGFGGGSFLGGGASGAGSGGAFGGNGEPGVQYGGGGAGGFNYSGTDNRSGGAGAAGIIRVELFA